MTIIATDGVTLAADSLAVVTATGERLKRPSRKIVYWRDKIYAACGDGQLAQPLAEWHAGGARSNHLPSDLAACEWTLLVIDRNGMKTLMNDRVIDHEVEPPFALGTADQIALGAMHADASPQVACLIACTLNIYCGAPVIEVDIAASLKAGRLMNTLGVPSYGVEPGPGTFARVA